MKKYNFNYKDSFTIYDKFNKTCFNCKKLYKEGYMVKEIRHNIRAFFCNNCLVKLLQKTVKNKHKSKKRILEKK